MDNQNKTYTAADFERYHSGAMSQAEMYALEKAALEDPFLEDALDGYLNTLNAEPDIEELRIRLAEKRKKKNIFSISSVIQNKWWQIAALFIIIGGAAYIFSRTNSSDKKNSIAKNDMRPDTIKTQNISPLQPDSTATKNDIAFENRLSSKPGEKQKTALPVEPLQAKKVTVPERVTESTISQSSPGKSKDYYFADSAAKIPSRKNDSTPLQGYVLTGKVTDHTGAPVPFAAVSEQGRRRATVADASGNFTIYSRDSSMFAAATATGFESKKIKLKKDSANTIVMNKNNSELTAVVVTSAYGANKRLKETNAAPKELAGKIAGVQIASSGLQPVGGRQKFEQYIKDSAVSIFDEDNEPPTGEVTLSFTINEEGQPKNIKITQSSCEACEKEAARLLQMGPAWCGKKNDYGSITIKF